MKRSVLGIGTSAASWACNAQIRTQSRRLPALDTERTSNEDAVGRASGPRIDRRRFSPTKQRNARLKGTETYEAPEAARRDFGLLRCTGRTPRDRSRGGQRLQGCSKPALRAIGVPTQAGPARVLVRRIVPDVNQIR